MLFHQNQNPSILMYYLYFCIQNVLILFCLEIFSQTFLEAESRKTENDHAEVTTFQGCHCLAIQTESLGILKN